jgi:hypothetical protein
MMGTACQQKDCFGGFKMMFMFSILGMMIPDGHMLQAG